MSPSRFTRCLARHLSTATALAGLCAATGAIAAPDAADRVYRGGTVITLDEAVPRATAVAISGDRIVAVGSDAMVGAHIGSDTVVTDLGGNTVVPGFIDSHSHLVFQGMTLARFVDLNAPPIGDVRSIDQLVKRLRARAADTPQGEWVIGFGYDDTLVAEHRHPTREDLDRVSTEHPVWVNHVSGHMGVGNSLALTAGGLNADSPDPEGGVIHRDPDTGEPTGLLEESAAMGPVLMKAFASIGPEDLLAAVDAAVTDYLSKGVTTAQDGAASAETLEGLAYARSQGLLRTRVVAYPTIDVTLKQLEGEYQWPFEDDGFLKLGATKLFSDGSIQGYTGYLTHPYHVPRDTAKPDYRGYPQTARDKLAEQVMAVHRSGGQIAVHGNGDAAIDDILHAFERAQAAAPREDARPVLIHAQMAREDQLDKMAELGVIPSMFNMHTYYWGDRHRDIFIGPERAARISPARSAERRGIPFTFHADTPVVPMEPLRMLWSGVTRQTSGGEVLGPEQRVSAERALRALTIDVARQYFDEDDKGSIAVGKLADLVVLDGNPLTVAPDDILAIGVVQTLVGGEVAYQRD
ncbi:amidohydrolase [Parahaliea mediterranea]|uniref:Amidohydrolase n=1 Tax=Parahaliea mediterranea TaxID=651086 RepID=A0A939DJK4_9GAMM|nr:amidohydrolase [Parahaliea mediterranea]MBN7798697.1 amidohydrolase [Parahaliea mediterranea]